MSNAIYTTGRANLDRANFPPQETQLSINNSLLSVFVAVQNSMIFCRVFFRLFFGQWAEKVQIIYKRWFDSVQLGTLLIISPSEILWSQNLNFEKKPNKIEPELYSQHCGYFPRLRPNSMDGLSKIKTDKKSQ